MHTDIDYYAPHGGPDNDRKMKEASWLCSQAFIESLRVYPDPFDNRPIRLPGECIAFDGNTQSACRPHQEHVETAMRRRISIAPADADWLPEQLPQAWPYGIPEGEWRGVGPLKGAEGERAGSNMSKFYRPRSGGVMTPGWRGSQRSARGVTPTSSGLGLTGGGGLTPPVSGRGMTQLNPASGAAVEPTSPAGGGMDLFNK